MIYESSGPQVNLDLSSRTREARSKTRQFKLKRLEVFEVVALVL